ncbi:cell division ftsj-like protein [Plakobranchus ocellatus]|uniref:Cell division ftsj-like protein n=1 Tax=Plakobranchus ocellatus TaxID=259542 RepID=A0AAV4BJN2_9GAST|nr:cell division ftsj-like protein [Plakobranchus ocellatus]
MQTIQALFMLVDSTISDKDGIKYLLSNRLNQDCAENLFAVIRSKDGYQNNPDPQEFRFALRQLGLYRSKELNVLHQRYYLPFISGVRDISLIAATDTSTSSSNTSTKLRTSTGDKPSKVSQGRRHRSAGERRCLHRGLHMQETDSCCM